MGYKKGFGKLILDDPLLFLACGFVIFSPIWIINWAIHGFNWTLTTFFILSSIHVTISYRKFNPEKYSKRKELTKWVDSLTLKEIEELKAQKENKFGG